MVLLVTIHGLNREKAYAERIDKSFGRAAVIAVKI